MFERIRGIFSGRREKPTTGGSSGLDPEERAKSGADKDPLRADERGDSVTAIQLYEKSVAENFVGSHPYEALAGLYVRRRNPADALHVTEFYTELARGGKMPRGAQRSADRKLPEFESRAERYRRLTSAG